MLGSYATVIFNSKFDGAILKISDHRSFKLKCDLSDLIKIILMFSFYQNQSISTERKYITELHFSISDYAKSFNSEN